MKPMPLLTISSKETIEKCANLEVEDSDIFLCSYPKSGTTWCQFIVISLVLLQRKKKNLQNVEYGHVSELVPFFEIDPHWDGENLTCSIREKHKLLGRRIFNTHLRGDMLPKRMQKGGKNIGKFVYITRNPLDTCVSFYHHLSHQLEGQYEKSLREFYDEWVNGEIPFGSWSDHIISYAALMANDEVLHMSYEDLVLNPKSCLIRLTEFLELDQIEENDIISLLPTFSFASMKKDITRFQPKSVTWVGNFSFLRKGLIGDNKNELEDEIRQGYKDYLKKLVGSFEDNSSIGRALSMYVE